MQPSEKGVLKLKLYVIRHGQSVNNLGGCYTGRMDVSLTSQGEADATRAGELLRGVAFDKVYSSDLSRAVRTQQLALPDAKGERTALLREIDVGTLAGHTLRECLDKYGDEHREHRRIYNYKPYGGECYEEIIARARQFLEMVARSPYETVAAFCHSGILHVMLDLVLGARLDKSAAVSDNGGITVFEYQGGKWRLKVWNYVGEL